MKKTYIQPSIEMGNMETEQMICSSLGVASDNGIIYGGVDVDGSKDPSSRRSYEWEDGLEEEF